MGTVRLDTMSSHLQESVTSNLASTSVNKGRASWRHSCICETNFRMWKGNLAFYRCWKATKGQSYRILECKKRGTRPMWAWLPTLLCPLINGRLEGEFICLSTFLSTRGPQRVSTCLRNVFIWQHMFICEVGAMEKIPESSLRISCFIRDV